MQTKKILNELKPINNWKNFSIGCDPEFFIKDKKGNVVGAEKIIDKTKGKRIIKRTAVNHSIYGDHKIIVDGVQAELNPGADTCRARIINTISSAFKQLEKTAKEKKMEK